MVQIPCGIFSSFYKKLLESQVESGLRACQNSNMKYKLSIFSLLQLLILFINILVIIIYYEQGQYYFVNYKTILYSIILSIIVFIQLCDAKKNQNYLLFILSLWLLLYVLLRVLSLIYTDYSLILEENYMGAEDVNTGLITVICGSVVMWLALHYFHIRKDDNVKECKVAPNVVDRALIFYWAGLVINILSSTQIPLIGMISNILSMYVFSLMPVFFVFSIIVILNWNYLNRSQKIKSILAFISFAAFLTIGGSRGGVFTLLKLVMYTLFALEVCKIKIKYLLGLILVFPIMLFLFAYSTYMRQTGTNIGGNMKDKLALVEVVYNNTENLFAKDVLAPVFNRIGFLDYSTVYIKKRHFYSAVINFPNEAKSVVDNALSPGFDLFDAAKVSNLISTYTSEKRIVRKSQLTDDNYESCEFTIFGELAVLFGLPFCLLFLFIFTLMFRSVWVKAKNSRTIYGDFNKAFCLYIFDMFLSSYGLDWIALHLVCLIISIHIFYWFVFTKSRKMKASIQMARY